MTTWHSVTLISRDGRVHAIHPASYRSRSAAHAAAKARARDALGALVVKLFADEEGLDRLAIVNRFGVGHVEVSSLH